MTHRFLLFVLLIFTISRSAISQGIEDIILNKITPDCEEIALPSSEIFAHYIKINDIDSAKLIMKYWEEKCQISEPLLRAKILVNLLESNTLDSLIDENFMWYLYNFVDRKEYEKQQNVTYSKSYAYFGFIPSNSSFDIILEDRFSALKKESDLNSQEYLISKLYSGESDSMYYEIQKPEHQKSKLYKTYSEEVNRIRGLGEIHFSWITGMWIPTGKLKKLGAHPDIGFSTGGKKSKWNYDFIMTFKFLKAKNYYEAKRKSSNNTESTNKFFGGQFGFELGRDILAKKNHEFQFISGIGMDGIDVLEEDKDQDLDAQSIISYNLNVGVGYRFYTNGKNYLGLRAKYNIINYTINNVIDLTGNAFTLHFTIGNVSNYFKSNSLKHLKQKLRQ